MKLKLNFFIILTILLSYISCTISPQPIAYGQDQCAACKMIISDKKFGAELVTTKGKIYKYDAIECLVPELLKKNEEHYSFIMVTDYLNPGNLINATESSYLFSKNLPSPMGGYLSSFRDEKSAKSVQILHQGEIINWNFLKKKYQ
jgi:copper chaperone NosL